jgi:hypothetical protein
MRKSVALTFTIAMFSSIGNAHAAIAEFVVTNMKFDDGGTASGHFSVDTTTLLFTDFDVLTTPGSVITSSFEYTPKTAHISALNFQYPYVTLISNAPALGPDARWMPLDLTSTPRWVEAQFLDQSSPLRIATGGEVIGQIPEPAGIVYVLSGLLMVTAWFRRHHE